MKNQIKEALYSFVIAVIILLLGFAPVGQTAQFSLNWKNLGVKMVEAGVIDKDKFEELYNQRGGFTEEAQKLLYTENNENLKITEENSGIMLNMLWALGLGNKNPILENGPMMDPRYGSTDNFASTGGWTLGQGSAMDHYSMHSFINLTAEQQKLVENVTKNIFRPCCGNPTHFPDCNHGMAMLGLMELMASQGATEKEMYAAALKANTLWFPGQYDVIKNFFESKNTQWEKVDPKIVLGEEYSSSSGYQLMLSKMEPQQQKGGTGCGA